MKTLLASLAGIAALFAGTPAPAAPLATRPTLIVAISVDQFADELYRRYRGSFTGGLARLGQGIDFTGYQSHAATETCPGHSTLLTGRHPSATGIVANTWRDPATGQDVYCVQTPGADKDARGPQSLRVSTFGEWLKRAEPAARAVAISGKDRAAIMMAGHRADAVYWWDGAHGFVTQPTAGPADAAVTAPAQAFDDALLARWRASPPALWPRDVSARCQGLERAEHFGGLAVSGRVPPDGLAELERGPDYLAKADFQGQLHASPAYDRLVLDFATDTVDRLKLGRGPATDLLALSLSATDYIGHRYGNGGAEMCVQMAALDAALGRFFAALDRTGVRYMVVLTADHGGSDAPERAVENGTKAQRLDAKAFVAALNAHLRRTLGLDADPIAGPEPQQLTVLPTDPALRARIIAAAVAWLKAQPQVSAVFTRAQVAARPAPRGKRPDRLTLLEKLRESYDPARSGDIQVTYLSRTTLYMPHKAGDAVAGHGSPWDYDRRVPILFWWPGVQPADRRDPIETVDIAPTLAALARVPAPPVDGRCLPAIARCGRARR